MSKVFAWITGVVLCTLHLSTWATMPDDDRPIIKAAITPAQDYSDEFIRQRSAVTALGPSLFGDNTGLSTGVTEFATTDVEVPGNTALPVRIARRYRVDYRTAPMTGKAAGLFNDWDLDLPHLHGTFAYTAGNATSGWTVSTPGQPAQRCSVDTNNPIQAIPPPVSGDGSLPFSFQGYQYWHGNSLYIPGQGDQTLMVISPGNTNRPSDGAGYHWLTSDQWMASCLPTTANGVPGEGFLVVSPDGTKYWFNWFAKVYASSISATGGTFPLTWLSELARQEQYIFPTRIEDRFGNYVTYTYDPSQPMRLQSIHASDGRDITLTYNAAGTIDTATTIDVATTVSKTWTYAYAADGSLYQAILPDSTRWQFDLGAGMGGGAAGWRDCVDINPPVGGPVVKTITHPSGAVGAFTFQTVRLGRSYVPKACGSVGNSTSPLESKYADVVALTRKEISGPGMATPFVWTFAYGADNASWTSECTPLPCVTTRQITATQPDGSSKRYTFSNRYDAEEGILLSVEVLNAAMGVVKSEVFDYQRDATGQPYPARLGKKPCYYCDTSGELLIPSNSRVITQQGATFSAVVSAFDVFANPATVTRSSSLGYSRSETTLYHHDTAHWVLHQVQTVTEGSSGAVMQSNVYDSLTATLTSTRQFGQPATTMAYYADGTLWTQTDGASHATTFSNYKRGLPQNVAFADGNSVSVIVNDFGQITSLTNAAGYVTAYEYDLGGRLSKVTYPTGDETAWNATTLSLVPATSDEYGLPAGHWKQVISTGTARSETYFDALWRPVLSRVYDNANLAGTARMIQRRYDAQGHESFVSYPQASIASITTSVDGTTTQYDALGRVTDISAASELGTLTTMIRYLNGFQKQVTNPRLNVTTTAFQAFDEPVESAPVSISAPLTATTTIARDIFGKPTSITRSGMYNAVTDSATRSYVYDANQRLCKTIEPESGATVLDYNTANRVAWSASGQALPGTTACDRASVLEAQKVVFGYDLLNRPSTTTFGDGSPSLSSTYTADGLPETVSADNSVWTTLYNRRRLPTSETLNLDGVLFAIGYTHDANGHANQMTYPNGTAIGYAPNALGEATQVGAYATLVKTHPNGALASFRYGNGIDHTTTQNTRGLPSLSTEGSVLNDGYTYDENANVVGITDQAQAGLFTRTMGYDALDRLTSANNVGAWGGALSYEYDALDNLRRSTTPFIDLTHVMTAGTQRLDRIVSTSSGQTVLPYTYDTRGRVRTRNGQTFTIDLADRVTAVDPGVASYRYDGYGHRTTITKNGASIVQVYTPAGQLVFESSPSGSDLIFRNGFESSLAVPFASPTVAGGKSYIFLGRHLIAEDGTAGRKYLHTDGLGSPVAKTNAAGTVLNRSYYEPYGWTTTPAQAGPGFTGHVTDTETGLSYMQARYYDPYAGRFLSTDPMRVDAASAGNFNRYWYAANSPYRFTDPDGRQSVGEMIDSGAQGCGAVSCAGWAALSATWKVLGAENVSQIADKGWSNASTGDKVGAVLAVAAALPPVKIVGAVGGKVTSALVRANEVQSVLNPRTQRAVTTAVAETEEGVRVFGSSEGALRPAQRAALTDGEIAAKGERGVHAEINAVNGAREAGLTPTSVSPSRPACAGCQKAMEEEGIPIVD